jgi:uncharacterized damage-inducible protein DinB
MTASTAPPDTRPQPPSTGAERVLLDGFLDFHRETLLWKCAGLTDDQLRTRAVSTSGLTLLGLVRHLTEVERGWFFDHLPYEATPIYFSEAAPNDDFDALDSAPPREVLARYRTEVDRIRQEIAAVPLDHEFTDKRGKTFSLRWVYLHMIEEYARHNGHADLLREAIDGVTGE